jgi:hypothetical protein
VGTVRHNSFVPAGVLTAKYAQPAMAAKMAAAAAADSARAACLQRGVTADSALDPSMCTDAIPSKTSRGYSAVQVCAHEAAAAICEGQVAVLFSQLCPARAACMVFEALEVYGTCTRPTSKFDRPCLLPTSVQQP